MRRIYLRGPALICALIAALLQSGGCQSTHSTDATVRAFDELVFGVSENAEGEVTAADPAIRLTRWQRPLHGLPRLGLDEDTYRALAENCTHIVHAAGLVRMNLPLEGAILGKKVTYDLARQMEGSQTVPCSKFADEIINRMG